MKMMFAFGTRPEVIKLAPVVLCARKIFPELDLFLCATGQHRAMQEQALATFSLTPDVDLDVMLPNQTLAMLTTNLMSCMTSILQAEKPDWLVVQGDTTTAFVSALAAFYLQIPVAHVEAGLRTRQLTSPFPEELNRQLLGRIASQHFAPTRLAANHLLREGLLEKNIKVTGNTVVDALLHIQAFFHVNPELVEKTCRQLVQDNDKRTLVLITCHRRESFGEPLIDICRAIATLARLYPDIMWIYPVHLNPNVQTTVNAHLANFANVMLIAPLDYISTLYLMSKVTLVMTDSGGIQEEAPSFGKPTVVMRDYTERQEGVDAGCAVLAGTKAENIIQAVQSYLAHNQRETPLVLKNPYGDGNASLRILNSLQGVHHEDMFDG